jgi:DNA sulfur modification protein DndB
MKDTIEIDAIKIAYNDGEYYLASFCAKDLFNLTAVTRAEEDTETGYQRTLSKGRVNKIAAYLDDGHMIPGSLILSSIAKNVDYNSKTKKLTIEKVDSSLLVIDGQHRLYGSYKCQEDVYLPVCIFFGLDKGTEVQYFLDVNGYQMGVPKTLRLELEKFSADENSEEFLLKNLFDELDDNPSSPLSGKMSRTKSVSGKLSHVAFQSGIKPFLSKAPFNVFSLEQKKKILINFLQALEIIVVDIFGDNKKISNSAFFQAVMACFMDVCHVTKSNTGEYKRKSFEKALEPLAQINWDLHTGTNKSAIKNLSLEIVTVISEQVIVSDDIF